MVLKYSKKPKQTPKKSIIDAYCPMKAYIVTSHETRLYEMVLMRHHEICFHRVLNINFLQITVDSRFLDLGYLE